MATAMSTKQATKLSLDALHKMVKTMEKAAKNKGSVAVSIRITNDFYEASIDGVTMQGFQTGWTNWVITIDVHDPKNATFPS